MSYKVVQRISEHSATTGAARAVLKAVGEAGWEDGVLNDPSVPLDKLARFAGVSTRTAQRVLPEICTLGELVYFRAIGRGRTSVWGVLCGLARGAREQVYAAAWRRAAVDGGMYELLDGETTATDPKRCHAVTLWTGRHAALKGDSWSPFRPRKGDILVRKGDSVTPFTADLSISGFPGIPVLTTTGQGAGAPGGNEGRGLPPGVVTGGHVDERLVRRLVGLKVYPHVATREAGRQDPAWLDECIRHVEALQRLGPVPEPGGLLATLIQAGPPLPTLPVPTPPAGGAPEGPLFAPPPGTPTAAAKEPVRQVPGGLDAALDAVDDEETRAWIERNRQDKARREARQAAGSQP